MCGKQKCEDPPPPLSINTDNCANIQTHNTHILQNDQTHTHTLYCWQAGRLSGQIPGLWWRAGLIHSCLVKRVYVCLCVCVLVVKSTLATVCLSISPVWQRWKELLFRGQPHPTLINNAARASGKGQRGAGVEGDDRGKKGPGRAPA